MYEASDCFVGADPSLVCRGNSKNYLQVTEEDGCAFHH